MWLSASCMRTERGESSQWHFSKELCVNSKPKPRKASKQDGVTENTQYSQICVVCLNYQSVASGPHRFFVRDYSFDLEEQKQREIMQLSFHKKEQYVSQTLHTLSEGFFLMLRCFINALLSFTGNLCTLAEGEFQWSVCCLDSLESIAGVCGISPEVGTWWQWWFFFREEGSRLIHVMIFPFRYGLPVNYQALLLQTDRKHSKKLKEELASLFVHLDPTASITDVRSHSVIMLSLY